MQHPEQIVLALKQLVEKELKDFFLKKKAEAKTISTDILEILRHIEEFTLRGGKRLRSIFFILAFQGFSPKKNIKNVIKLSIIWELLQSYLLIHDDIIDQDDLRRGGPTIHRSLAKHFKNEHQGMSHAILSGNLLSHLSFELLADPIFKMEKNILNTLTFLNLQMKNVIYGEMLDCLDWKKIKTREKHIRDVHALKTVSYTTMGPIISGAILAGKKIQDLKHLVDFCIHLGLAFQLKDDLLGVFGNSDKTGKSITSDIKDGKLTNLIAHILKEGSINSKKLILKHLGNQNLTLQDFAKIKDILIKEKAKEKAEKLLEEYSKKAIKSLELVKMPQQTKQVFLYLTNHLVKREL